jgi:Ca2+/Na+ antiporter
MSGWLRHLVLTATVQTGFSTGIIVWSLIAVASGATATVFLLIAAFVWITQHYDAVTAGVALGGVFLVIAVGAGVACLVMRRRTIERARLELAARGRASANWLDPRLIGIGLQVGRSIGWKKLASVVAVGALAAGLAKEWTGRDQTDPES